MKENEEYNPWPSYFLIGAGVCVLGSRFFGEISQWTTIDITKVIAGVAIIGIGVFRLVKKK
jgi:hypothetical protein